MFASKPKQNCFYQNTLKNIISLSRLQVGSLNNLTHNCLAENASLYVGTYNNRQLGLRQSFVYVLAGVK